jgi:flavin-dependent dehydrogenase
LAIFIAEKKMRSVDHDIVIIGGGPAGLTAGLYASRAGIEAIVMGTSTETPLAAGESVSPGVLGEVAAELSLWAPCPVIVVPPALIPGLSRG